MQAYQINILLISILMAFIYYVCPKNLIIEHKNDFFRIDNTWKTYIPRWKDWLIHYENYLETFPRITGSFSFYKLFFKSLKYIVSWGY